MNRMDFYRLEQTFKQSQECIKPFIEYDFRSIQTSDSVLIENNKFKVYEGTKWFDIIRFQDVANFAISEKVKIMLEENNTTGWSCFPIEIQNNEDKKYYGFQVLSKAGKILNLETLILNLETLNNYEEEFVEFDIATWNGTDIFTLEGTSLKVVTPQVEELFIINKITNVEFGFL